MAIYSNDYLNFILNEAKRKSSEDEFDGLLKRAGDNLDDMGDDLKKAGKKIKSNAKKTKEEIKDNVRKTKDKFTPKKKKSSKKIKIEGYNLDNPDAEFEYSVDDGECMQHCSLLEGNILTKDGKTYKKLTKAELSNTNFIRDNKSLIIDVSGEKYIQVSNNNGDPSAMGIAGSIGGGYVGYVGGTAIGTGVGSAVGATIGGIAGGLPGAGVGACAGGLTGAGVGAVTGTIAGAKTGYKIGKKLDESVEHYDIEEFHQVDPEGYIIVTEADKAEVLPNGMLKVGNKLARPVKKSEKLKPVKFGEGIKFHTKKYIYQNKEDSKKAVKHPFETTGQYVGSAVGAATMSGGGPIGSAIGAAGGSAVGKIAGGAIDDYTKDKIKASKIKSKKESFDFRNVYRSPEYSKAIHEYFDCEDEETRKILLAVNEDDQTRVLVSLTSKLYDNIVDKVDDIDFGQIPATKGDITKLSNYQQLIECLDTMNNILIEYKQDTAPVDIIRTAISNIIDSTNIWKRAFQLNAELPMVMYNTIILSIIESTSYMISMCINYIKVPGTDTFQATIDKSALVKTKDHLVFDNLRKFNDAYRKGQITSSMEYILKSNTKNFMGELGIGTAAVGIVTVLFCIVPIMRELIFLFYYNRVRISEYFDMQADMLQINAYNVEHSRPDLTAEQKKSISAKQMKIVERFRKISNKFAIQMKESEVKASKELTKENKKYKADEVMDEVPDSAASALF